MFKIIINLYLIFLISSFDLIAQDKVLTLEDAIALAIKNDPSIAREKFAQVQNEKMQGAGFATPRAQLFISGEEFNFDGLKGVQSLNAQQNFYLPKVSKAYNGYYQALANKSSHQLILTERQVEKNIEQAYYNLLFAKRKLSLLQESQSIYFDFQVRTIKMLELGETGKIPLATANIMVQNAKMDLDHAAHEAQLSKELFNIWLGTNNEYDISEAIVLSESMQVENKDSSSSYLEILKAEKEVVAENINIQKANLLPQINAGARLQSVNGDLLFFGYQAGLNIPLFRKSQKKKIQAAEIELEIQDANINAKKKELELNLTTLRNHTAHLQEKISYLENDLLPAVEEQQILLEKAYQSGEGNYMEYVLALKNYMEMKLMLVELSKEYYVNIAEIKYWSNSN